MINFNTNLTNLNIKSQKSVSPLQKGLTGSLQYRQNLTEDTVSFSSRSSSYKRKDKSKVQEDNSSKNLDRTNKKLVNMATFLTSVEHTPDKSLKSRDKEHLNRIKQELTKLENCRIKEQETKQRLAEINEALQNRAKMGKPKKPTEHVSANVDLTYKNSQKLKSTPNFPYDVLKLELRKNVKGIINLNKSAERISSLSVYLKEKMIGFEVPAYQLKGQKRGGYQWFERGLENLLIGSSKPDLKPEEYKDTAKELFGILAVHDNYWKSPEFSGYLKSLKTSKTITENQIKAVDATTQAIKELNTKSVGFGAIETIKMKDRAFTPLKRMPEIMEKCAYTGKTLYWGTSDQQFLASADHIIPHSWEKSSNDDGNFIISSSTSNTARGNMSLIKYLKGYSEI